MELKNSIDLNPEYSMGDHIHHINDQQTVNEIRQGHIIIQPVYHTDLLCCEYRYLSQVKHHTHYHTKNK